MAADDPAAAGTSSGVPRRSSKGAPSAALAHRHGGGDGGTRLAPTRTAVVELSEGVAAGLEIWGRDRRLGRQCGAASGDDDDARSQAAGQLAEAVLLRNSARAGCTLRMQGPRTRAAVRPAGRDLMARAQAGAGSSTMAESGSCRLLVPALMVESGPCGGGRRRSRGSFHCAGRLRTPTREFAAAEECSTKLAVGPHFGKCELRLWLISFVIVALLSCGECASFSDHGPETTKFCPAPKADSWITELLFHGTDAMKFCPASSTEIKRSIAVSGGCITEILDHGSQGICPAPKTQLKKSIAISGDDWISGRTALLIEQHVHEYKRTEVKKNGCTKPRVGEQILSSFGAVLSMTSNLAPLVPMRGIASVSPERKMLLFLCSLALFLSNLSWMFYFGADECKNWISYFSLGWGSWCQSYFTWLFWKKENVNIMSVSSLFGLLVSLALNVMFGTIANTHFVRIGPKILFAESTIAGLGGIFGIIFTMVSVHFRRVSSGDMFNLLSFILTLCGVGGALSSLCATLWFHGTSRLSFELGICIFLGGRMFDAFQLWSYRCTPVRASVISDISVPLLSSSNDVPGMAESIETVQIVIDQQIPVETAEVVERDEGDGAKRSSDWGNNHESGNKDDKQDCARRDDDGKTDDLADGSDKDNNVERTMEVVRSEDHQLILQDNGTTVDHNCGTDSNQHAEAKMERTCPCALELGSSTHEYSGVEDGSLATDEAFRH